MIAVTGANGLLGSYIVRRLAGEHIPFVAFRREMGDVRHLADLDGKISWRTVDLLDPVALNAGLDGVTGVVHAAGLVSARRKKVMMANHEATANVVNACLERGIERLLHISSVSVFSDVDGKRTITETDGRTMPARSNYAISKYLAEVEVFRGQEEGLRTVIINPSVILSRPPWHRSSGRVFNYMRRSGSFYIGGSFHYVDVRDVAELAVRLFHSNIENDRFIVSAGAITFREFFERVALLFQKQPPRIRIGRHALTLLAFAESFRARLTGSEPMISSDQIRSIYSETSLSNDRIKASLQFEFQPVQETLSWCCRSEVESQIFV